VAKGVHLASTGCLLPDEGELPVPLALAARVDRAQALRYLGPGPDRGELPDSLNDILVAAEQWALSNIVPLGVHRTGLVCRDTTSAGGLLTRVLPAGSATCDGAWPVVPLELPSVRLASLLVNSDRATLLAVTLGSVVDERIDQLSRDGRLAEAVVLDAVASASAECAADDLCHVIAAEAAEVGRQLTRRFSPGYGDLPLAVQAKVLCWLGASRIGLAVTPSSMLVPQKSVTAVAGWAPLADGGDQRSHRRSCGACDIADCRYRDSDRPDRRSEVHKREP